MQEERSRNNSLESMLSASKQQLRQAEEKNGLLEENMNELQQKVSMMEVYR